jgi:hypothetical protein
LLRVAIDRGKSADKASFPDPAAASLGTDDEAAGTPLTREQVARSLSTEVADRPTDHEANTAVPSTSATPQVRETSNAAAGHGRLVLWLVSCIGALALIALVVLMAS